MTDGKTSPALQPAQLEMMRARNNIEMEMWSLLTAINTVVLESEYSEKLIRLDKRFSDPFRRARNGSAFFVREIEYRCYMSTRNHTASTGFKLPRVNDGKCQVAFIDDRPPLLSACHFCAKIAGVSHRKLDRSQSRLMPPFALYTHAESVADD